MSDTRFDLLRSSLSLAQVERSKHETPWDLFLMAYCGRPMDGRSTLPTDKPRTRAGFATVNLMVAAGSIKKPKMFVKPRRSAEVGNARIVEAFLDQWWNKYKVQMQIVRADRDSKVFGHGWLKTTWNYQERQGRKVEPPAELVDAMLADSDKLSEVMGTAAVPDRAAIVRFLREKLTQVAVDEPVVQRISPYDVWVDPQATEWEMCRWVCHRYFRRMESLQADNMLSRNRFQVQPTAMESSFGGAVPHRTTLPRDGALARTEIWEMWDLEEERLYIWATGGEKKLYDGDWPYAIGQPFSFLPCYEMPEHFYPMGVMELISPKLAEMNTIRGEELATLRRQRVKWLTRLKYMDKKMRSFLESGQDMQVHAIDDERVELSGVLHRLDPPSINPDLFRMGDGLRGEIYEETGVSEYARGYAQTVRSATEVDTISQWSSARVQQMTDNSQGAMVDVARKLVGLAQQNLTRGDIVRLVGEKEYAKFLTQGEAQYNPKAFPDRKEVVIPFDRTDIAGEFDFSLEAGSGMPDNEQVRRQNVMQLAQILIAMPEANKEKILEQMVDAFGFPDPTSWILPPDERMMAQQGVGSPPAPGGPPGPGMATPAGLHAGRPGTGRGPTQGREQEMAAAGKQGGKTNVGR